MPSQNDDNDLGRPIKDAGEQVRETAALAADMLEDLRQGFLWKLLIRQPTPKPLT